MNSVEIGLYDSTFMIGSQKAIGLAGENTGRTPNQIVWVENEFRDVTVFTDIRLPEIENAPKDIIKIAWLIEPRCFSSSAYEVAYGHVYKYSDYVISHERAESALSRIIHVPVGGSWIKDWMIFEKDRNISMFTTDKTRTAGHRLRHRIHTLEYEGKIDFFGRGSNPVSSKAIGLRQYRFSIVIETCRIPGYFTEKLIDCISQGTIPIYWGAPDIYRYFDPDGIISWSTPAELDNILTSLVNIEYEYAKRHNAIQHNLQIAQRYRCCEDYAFSNYPWIFGW